ncbi:MAG: hypothetical protein JW701_07160, partial [Kosmotogaceae bacterium]|nr:hypothetical protein [Kosmotogaceae bacterium]
QENVGRAARLSYRSKDIFDYSVAERIRIIVTRMKYRWLSPIIWRYLHIANFEVDGIRCRMYMKKLAAIIFRRYLCTHPL